MADIEAFYRLHLKEELEARKKKNRRFSTRAFARKLGVDNGFLSRLLNNKALLSIDLADQMSRKLQLTGEVRRNFLLSVAEEQRCRALYLVDPTLTDCEE